ncbi:transposase [Opitutus sp. ER46]|uniref:transposase n=1 Tax=Opitutus sp. ER46 TaxID=2161864 RepID=UPI001E5E3DA6|nr:transposase [Opitutus sp. ER46]
MYHLVNRGNYRSDVFVSPGAASAFEEVLKEACQVYQWRLHAYALMRNHFHLAVTTPHADLSQGMQWLETTFACRFNRFRVEQGHLFQGRFHAGLIEDAVALGNVVDYIHLNPVKARIVPPEQVARFRWSSARQLMAVSRWECMSFDVWLAAKGLAEDRASYAAYVEHLIERGRAIVEQRESEVAGDHEEWAIGTEGWKQSLAREHAQHALAQGLIGQELKAMRAARWQAAFASALRNAGRRPEDLDGSSPRAEWKVAVAQELRRSGVPYGRIATMLGMSSAGAIRTRLWKARSERV